MASSRRLPTSYNTSTYGGSSGGLYIEATGGVITQDGDYRVHAFLSDANFVVNSLGSDGTYGDVVEYLVVAGGGGGGHCQGPGGGGGGFRANAAYDHAVTAQTYGITVGAGGAGGVYNSSEGVKGGNSVFDTITSEGGGKGGDTYSGSVGGNGGSGGGGASGYAGGTATSGQGYNGGSGINSNGGGGGGAGEVGADAATNGGDGGDGLVSTIYDGSSITYSGGGGGGSYGGTGGSGGAGGGGDGLTTEETADAGTPNTGGGGGGSGAVFSCTGAVGGAGGSGIVIIRYKYIETRDYTALATWEAATDNDLVTATAGEVLECYDDAASFDDSVTLAGATTNSSYFRVVKPATGEGHDGTPNNGFTIKNDSFDGNAFEIVEQYSQVQNLIVIDTTHTRFMCYSRGDYAAFVGCIGKCTNLTAFGATTNNNCYFINCLAYESYTGFESRNYANNVTCYNCTAVDCTNGFDTDNAQVTKNCIACDCTNDIDAGYAQTTCYEGDAVLFVNQAGDDYHLAAGDTTCRGEGTDLSSDGTYAFDDDIDGDTRSAWDIGADEYGAVAPTGWAGTILGVASPANVMGVAAADIANVCGV